MALTGGNYGEFFDLISKNQKETPLFKIYKEKRDFSAQFKNL